MKKITTLKKLFLLNRHKNEKIVRRKQNLLLFVNMSVTLVKWQWRDEKSQQ